MDKIEIKLYDLTSQEKKFKTDFKKMQRILKVHEQKNEDSYYKIDIVEIKRKLYLIKRYANFKTNEALMQIQEIKKSEYNYNTWKYNKS